MGLRSFIRNITKRGVKDITNPDKIRNYLDGAKVKSKGIQLDYEEILPFAEQLVFRSIRCKECFKNGSCSHCGCEQPLAGIVPKFECSQERFTKMPTIGQGDAEKIDIKAWKDFKEENGLFFKLGYNS